MSNKLILIFLGFILLIVVSLTSKQIATALRSRLAFLPFAKISPTPTLMEEIPTLSPSPTGKDSFGLLNPRDNTREIPATGPENVVWLILGGSFFAGITLKKLSTLK